MCLIACPATSTVARSAGWSAGRVSTCTVETELKGNPLVLFGRTKPANERHTRTHTQRGIDRDEVWSRRHPARTVAIGRMNPVLHLGTSRYALVSLLSKAWRVYHEARLDACYGRTPAKRRLSIY
jgi:hypothetical protein